MRDAQRTPSRVLYCLMCMALRSFWLWEPGVEVCQVLIHLQGPGSLAAVIGDQLCQG